MADPDHEIIDRIDRLVDEEHGLDRRHGAGEVLGDAERQRHHELEVQLDQMWDLLRQRRARRAAGLDPELAAERDENVVERYRQ
jgi:Protein of unknown function (DUF2630)